MVLSIYRHYTEKPIGVKFDLKRLYANDNVITVRRLIEMFAADDDEDDLDLS